MDGLHATGSDEFDVEKSLNGKRALVTGAAGGIGAACAKRLASEGAWCACADIVRPQQTLETILDIGGNACGFAFDVSEEKSVLAAFAQLEQKGGLDILVHCAGIIQEQPLLSTSAEAFDHVIAVNLRGTFLIGRESIRMMQESGGRIILIASDLGYSGRETYSAYCASKHAVLGLVRCWAKEFAPDVLVNAICPGPIDTDMLSPKNISVEWRQRELDIPLQRFGNPDEVAALACFLAGNESGFITGQGLGINGGSIMP